MPHAKAGAFLPVSNVQALAQTWHGSGEPVPLRYVRTEEIAAGEVVAGCGIPVVDLSRLLDPQSSEEELANLGSACQHWGFFQILSNGRYRSIVHRPVVHPDKERILATMFHQPCPSTTIGPLPELVKRDGGRAQYRYMDFLKRFFAAKLDGRRSHMDDLSI